MIYSKPPPLKEWPYRTFLDYYEGNRSAAISMAVDADLVGSSIISLMLIEEGEWRGSASELLEVLNELVPENARRTKYWPKAPNTLSGRLRRAATFLRGLGVEITFTDRTKKKREIIINSKKVAQKPKKGDDTLKGDDTTKGIVTPIVTGDIKENQPVKSRVTIGDDGDDLLQTLAKRGNFKKIEGSEEEKPLYITGEI